MLNIMINMLCFFMYLLILVLCTSYRHFLDQQGFVYNITSHKQAKEWNFHMATQP